MIIEVPLFIQTNQFNCGSTCLKMVLAHFGEHFGIEAIEKKMGIVRNKGINSIQIAGAAATLGYGVVFYTTSLVFNQKNNELDFYKKYNDLDSRQINIWVENSKKNGAILNEKEISLNELLKFVTEDSIPIVLLDWNIISDREEDGFQGHFVPVVGYDHKYVYVHNGGYNDHKANIPLEREIFDRARKARGTDEDVIIIFRKGTEIKLTQNEKVSEKIEIKEKKLSSEKPLLQSIKNNSGVSLKEVGIDKEKSLIKNKNIAEEVKLEKKEIMNMEKEVSEMKKKLDLMKEKLKDKDFGA